jgi:flavin-dependent dehydrogenase
MTVRSELDALCLKRCLERGASLVLVKAITSIREDSEGVEVGTNLGALRARYCLGADGAASVVRRLSQEFPESTRGFAIEGIVRSGGDASDPPEFDFFLVPRGYGWIFPKGDHLNVGLYTSDSRIPVKREMLNEYVQRKLGHQVISEVSAHGLGFGGWKYRPRMNRVFLVGDAAGLAEPLLGEGICNAIASGQAAAKAILAADTSGLQARQVFQDELRPIQLDVLSCARSARWFYRFPGLGFRLLTLPTTRYLLMRGFSGGFRFRTIKSQPWRVVAGREVNTLGSGPSS